MKWHKLKFNQIFKIATALIMLLSVGSVSATSQARHVRHNHVRISRQARRKVRKDYSNVIQFRKRRLNQRTRKSQRSLRSQIKRNCHELYLRTFYDINHDRRYYNHRPLRIDHRLNKIGQIRSFQLSKYFAHNTHKHNNEAQYLLNRRHIKYRFYGENIASSPLGTINVLAVGHYASPNDAQNSLYTYQAKNGYDLADNLNDASMNHDAADNYGHRNNILNPKYHKIGIGTFYSPQGQNYCVAAEFTN